MEGPWTLSNYESGQTKRVMLSYSGLALEAAYVPGRQSRTSLTCPAVIDRGFSR